MEAEVLGTGASLEAAATSETFRVGPFDDPDRYEIGEPVEAGAEGILYRGRVVTPTSRLSLSVAVKALQPAYASRIDQWAARWRDQVELLRSLQIPGLVGVREGFVGPLPHREGAEVAGRNLYLVMNWVEGEALDHWVLHHRGIDVRNALKLLLPVAVAVDTMHGGQLTGSVPVVHRDIKPANILIGHSGSVLVDFGLTKGLSIGHPVGRAGTPGYIAPEVVAGGGYTPAADRYAFGATVFFLLTGRHPPASPKPQELRRLLETSPLGGPGHEATIPPELVERVVTMLDPDPFRRPAALANWIAQLRQSSLDDEVLTVRLAPPAPARPAHTGAGRSASASPPSPGSAGSVAPSSPPVPGSGRGSPGRSIGPGLASAASSGRNASPASNPPGGSGPAGYASSPPGGPGPAGYASSPPGSPGAASDASSGRATSNPSGGAGFDVASGPALGRAGVAGGVGMSGLWRPDGGPSGQPRLPWSDSSNAETTSGGPEAALAPTAPWASGGTAESLGATDSSVSESDELAPPGAATRPVAGSAHRRGAHVAPRRPPQHAQRQRIVASRFGLLLLLLVAVTVVGSDVGAMPRLGPRSAEASGPTLTRPSPPRHSPPTASEHMEGFGQPSPLSGALGGDNAKKATTTTATTVASPGGGECFKSYDPACGALKWSPAVINKPLAFNVTYTPQNPLPGQSVTFTIDVTDPDDNPVQIVGAYYGDEGTGSGSEAASGAPRGFSSSCSTPYGAWPAPAPQVPGHIEQQMVHAYADPGSYQVFFVASSGRTQLPCALPDPYESSGQSATVTVVVNQPPPPPTTTSTSTTTVPVATTTTTTTAGTSSL